MVNTNTRDFWAQVRRRRNYFFAWWMGWPVASMDVAIGYERTASVEAPEWLMVGLFAVWFGTWLLVQRRVAALQCPRCSQPAIRHPFFFMRNARCRNCGLSYVAA